MLSGHMYEFSNNNVFLSLKIVCILANSLDPNEMPHFGAFYLGLHCLPHYLFALLVSRLSSEKRKKKHLMDLIFYRLVFLAAVRKGCYPLLSKWQ